MRAVDFEHADRNGKGKAPRPCASWIEIEHAFVAARAVIDSRLVGVAADDDIDSGSNGIKIEFIQIVDEIEVLSGELDKIGCRQLRRASCAIDVAANRCDRRELAKSIENGRIADVTRVENMIAAAQRIQSFRPQQTVCVGDHADAHRSSAYLSSWQVALATICNRKKLNYFLRMSCFFETTCVKVTSAQENAR